MDIEQITEKCEREENKYPFNHLLKMRDGQKEVTRDGEGENGSSFLQRGPGMTEMDKWPLAQLARVETVELMFYSPVGLLALLLLEPFPLELLLPLDGLLLLLLLLELELVLPILEGVLDVGVLGVVGVENVEWWLRETGDSPVCPVALYLYCTAAWTWDMEQDEVKSGYEQDNWQEESPVGKEQVLVSKPAWFK